MMKFRKRVGTTNSLLFTSLEISEAFFFLMRKRA
jgi:hypothetical protein